jgi:hypothetical protein
MRTPIVGLIAVTLVAVLLLSPLTPLAGDGDFVWAKQMGGTTWDAGRGIAVDAAGNVYTTGDFWGTADFDPGPGTFNLTSAGNRDIFVSKLDSAGNFVWAKQMGGPGGDFGFPIAVDAAGNVYTTGHFQGTADFDPGPGTFNLTSAGEYDIFVSKLDSAGNFLWAKQMGGTGYADGYGIALDVAGNVYTTGYFHGTADFDPGPGTFNLTSAGNRDIFVSKLDSAGNFVWAKQIGGTAQPEGHGIAVDAVGNVYTTGDLNGTADFDPGPGTFNLTSTGSNDIFVSKLDSAGSFVWAKQMGGTSEDYSLGLAVDAAGNVYTTGQFQGTADFDPGPGIFNLTSAGEYDIFVSKLDSAGNFLWAKQMGGTTWDAGTGIAVDAAGNVYTTGWFAGTADFDPGPGTFNLTSAGADDIFVSKLDSAGNLVCAKQMGGTGNDQGWGIAVDAAGNVYTTGPFPGTADFDPGPGVFNLTSAGSYDIFVSKLSAPYRLYLPLIMKDWLIWVPDTPTPRPTLTSTPTPNLKSLVTEVTLTLPQPLAATSGNWCTWGGCSLSPRLYHEPLSDGRTLVGWTDSSGNGHVSIIGNSGSLDQTYDFPALSVRGMVAHDDGKFAILLWNSASKIMWLSKRNTNGGEIWTTNIKVSSPDITTSFDPGIGDSRLTYGNGLYAAYFAVHGDAGWPQGHNGDQLTYVDSNGAIQSGGWNWGCSHSMAELVNYHPTLNKFVPACSSDCYASKGILLNDNQVVYQCDGNCGGLVSAQLGQIALSGNSWKLVFNALNRPGYVGRGIGLATIDGSFQSNYVWLTNTNGDYERDPVMARLGSNLQSDRYVVGWKTTNDGVYWLGVINGSGSFLTGPEEVSSAGIAWGNRDDSFRTRADGSVSWVQGNPTSTALHMFRFNGSTYIP